MVINIYTINKLGYDYDALEPYIDTHTLGLHYNKHYKNYLNKLNSLLIKNNYDFRYPLNELALHINEFNEEDRDNILFYLGGVINHKIYFESISPYKEEPNEYLTTLINNYFGSFNNFKEEFKRKALSLKGSGYTYLVISNNKLDIVNLNNQDNPFNYNYIPLLCIDMWEHSYYINYNSYKENYIDNFFEIIDFTEANKLFKNMNNKNTAHLKTNIN